ncbi:uncharacterized protein [Haliotis cracherodii]|uniref:uncharacterized protein isoform X1 n=1 Tax=Haliotis cracherodii TaxID=6455 RepID=UPI0039E73C9C
MNTFCLCMVTLSSYLHCTVSLEAVGCYGNTADDFLIPRCDSDKVIAIDNLYAIAKKVSSNCPQEYTTSVQASRQMCCSKNLEDCVMDYRGISDYHAACAGASSCTKKVAWQDTTCSGTGYLERSNYMLMNYRCIATSDIISIPSNASKNGKNVTIQNEGYPSSGINPNTDSTCSVTSSCDSSIAVTSLHLDFKYDAGGACQQYIDIMDGSSRNRIDCRYNMNYSSGTLYTSRAHFITVNLRSNLPTNSGRVWMQFHATHYQASIEVQCGTSMLTVAPTVPTCPETTTTSSPTSTIGNPKNRGRHRDDDDQSDGLSPGGTVGLTIGVVLLVLLLLILLCICCKKKQKKNELKVGKSLDDFPDSEFAEALGIPGTYTGSTAPAGSLLHTKPRRLTPIEAPGEGHVRTAWSTISSMTPTLSVIKHMSSASGKTDDSKSTQPYHMKTNVFEITREILEQNGKVPSHDINQNMKKWKEASGVHGN